MIQPLPNFFVFYEVGPSKWTLLGISCVNFTDDTGYSIRFVSADRIWIGIWVFIIDPLLSFHFDVFFFGQRRFCFAMISCFPTRPALSMGEVTFPIAIVGKLLHPPIHCKYVWTQCCCPIWILEETVGRGIGRLIKKSNEQLY